MRFAPFILLTLMAGALVGWFAPGGSGAASEPALSRAEQDGGRRHMAQETSRSGGDMVLNRAGDGHFYADVTIGGASALMLVDSGASVVALTGEDADALGVAWHPKDVEQVARGASGPVHGVRVTIDRIELGDLEARRVQAVVVPEGLEISLLGQSFLATIERVEVHGDEMVLRD